MLAVILILIYGASSEWNCSYKSDYQYNYNFTSTLLNGVPGKSSDTTKGVSVSGEVVLVPLKHGEMHPHYIQLSITQLVEYSILSPFSPQIDQTMIFALFYPEISKIYLPRGQNVHGSNILRGIISTLRINSCTKVGKYTVQESSILGTHNTTYTNEGTSRRDGGRAVMRAINLLIDVPAPVGNTAAKHAKFMKSLIQSSSNSRYIYLLQDGIVRSAVLSEKIHPVHAVGYASSSDVSVRTSLTLWSSGKDSLNIHSHSPSTLNAHYFAGSLREADLKMDYSVPDLAPRQQEFTGTVQHLQTMLNAGYIRTSPQVIRPWLDIVRFLCVGVPAKVYRSAFERADDSYSLPWLIDAANVNGTAQLHLAIHNAIRLGRAYELTERLISSKQFTPNPSTRMIKWLMKTCSIDRYREVCSLALSSSATNYLYYHQGSSLARDIYNFIRGRIMNAKKGKEKVFFIRSLGNIKMREASQTLIDLIHSIPNPDLKQVSLQSLILHPPQFVTPHNRSLLLSDALSRHDQAGTLFWALNTATLDTLPEYIKQSVTAMCPSHPLSSFLHETLTLLQDTRSNPQRAALVKSVVEKLYILCQYCLEASSTLPSDKVMSTFIFGNSMQGVEMLFERYSSKSTQLQSGTTTLILHYLKPFGIEPMILQTSFTLGDLDIFSRGYTTGDLIIVVAGDQVQIPTFQLNGDANVDVNVLLIDVTQLVPTLSGLPIAYSISGNVRTETTLDCSQFPTITVTNRIGLYITAMFRLDGVPIGYNTLCTMKTVYDNVHTVSEGQLSRYTSVKEMTFKLDTVLPDSWSNTKDNVEYYREFTTLNSTIGLTMSNVEQRGTSSCNVMPTLTVIDFGSYALPLDRHSYLSLWLKQNHLLSSYNSIYEISDWQCNHYSPIQYLDITSHSSNTLYTVDIQVMYGILMVNSHNRVKMFGDRGERNKKLAGSLTDIVEVLRTSKYFTLNSYHGPELMTIVVKDTQFVTQASVVFSVSDPCIT